MFLPSLLEEISKNKVDMVLPQLCGANRKQQKIEKAPYGR
tara:strand:+ start:166 stop:285 length:120 start_codon:yes stop_codon:yes gene_type:complete